MIISFFHLSDSQETDKILSDNFPLNLWSVED